jgi:bacteriophage N4 adsorption protein B
MSSDLCVRLRALPVGRSETGQTLLAVADPLDDADLAEVREALGHEPLQQIARESEIADGLRLIRGDADAFDRDGDSSVPLLGDVLIENGLVESEALEAALEDYRPSQHGRIGDFLVQRGLVSRESLLHSIAEQQRRFAGSDGYTDTNRDGTI